MSDASGEYYHCIDCDYPFKPVKVEEAANPSVKPSGERQVQRSMDYTKMQLEEPLKQIRKLKLKFRVAGALIALSGFAFLTLSSVDSLYLLVGAFYILLGAFLALW